MKIRLFLFLIILAFATGMSAQKGVSRYIASEVKKADASFNDKNYDEALRLYQDVSRRLSKKRNEAEMRLYVSSQINIARCHEKLESFSEGLKVSAPLLDLKLTDKEMKDAREVYSLNLLGLTSGMIYDGDSILEVRTMLEKALPLAEDSIRRRMNINIQKTYILESKQYLLETNQEKCKDILSKAYFISDDDRNRMDILFSIATVFESSDNQIMMLRCYKEAARLAKKVGDDAIYYRSLMAWRGLCREFNDMENFTKLGITLDSLVSKSTDPQVKLKYYFSVGEDFLNLGLYDIAESYFSSLYDFMNKSEGIKSRLMNICQYYNQMCDVKRCQKDYKAAIKYNALSRQAYNEMLYKNNYSSYLNYLIDTQLYSEAGDSLGFERSCDSLFHYFNLTNDVYNKSLVYNFRGLGFSKLGCHQKALYNNNKSDSILAQKYDETHEMRMQLLKMRIIEYGRMGLTAKACSDSRHYVELTKKVYGIKSEQYSSALYYYANALRNEGRLKECIEKYTEFINVMTDILRRQLRYVPSTDRTSYLSTLSKRNWIISSMALKYSHIDSEFVKTCYNNILVLKSLLFESDRSMYSTLQQNGSKEDVEDFIRLSYLRNRHRTLYRNYKKNKDEIDANYLEMRELDHKLSEKSKLYSEYTSFLDFKFEDVQKLLGKNDVLFDFFDYQYGGVRNYVAYVVKKDFKNPVIIDMFTESDVKRLLDGEDYSSLYAGRKAEAAIKLFWKSLKKYAHRGANVYYVPSGLVFQLSLEALPMRNGKLLGERYNFVRLTSARELVDLNTKLGVHKDAVVYGGLKYDVDLDVMQDISSKFDHSSLYSMRSLATGTNKFSYLPETLVESEKISSILRDNGFSVKFYSDYEGNEESFLSMHNKSPQILHMATHGFFYTPEEAAKTMYLKGSRDPMFLSGLVLSGANAAWMGKKIPEGVLGGIISSGNISCLDLSNIELVVLSACQTGKGRVTNEGLYGLQRAFKKSGVKSIVMTLWNVSDVVTRDFMVEFYNNLFYDENVSGDKKKSFEKARASIRDKYREPVYWAGFIMVD